MRKLVKIKGMTCGHCSARVEKMLKGLEGVADAVVDLEGENAIINLSAPVDDALIREAIDDAGYDVIDIQQQ
ncbi:heavy-metal-associated domain-containing protein [Anoxynatronum buryatiense]|uniref:Copper ion binding protein n=1 Tax=Anoxynatronum buryatiense TaxID=489973 RepID=A0AA45WWX2_9CLOT|nr:heavy-metal-associated domain-containing protein [Anoxynatronum buryatiense]SMP56177.1 copper ion binding protein [Anoxynatronum buryatiense]